MKRLNAEVDYIKKQDLLKLFKIPPSEQEITDFLFGKDRDFEVVFFDSGKAALFYILSYFRHVKKIPNKNAELFVPRWIGSWVLNIAQKVIFPSLEFSENTVGLLCYHQYGYEQNMEEVIRFAREKNIFVIEDCAHSLFSFDTLRGDAGIFSLSKFFPVPMGGVAITRNQDMFNYLNKKSKKSNFFVKHFSFFVKGIMSSNFSIAGSRILGELVEMSYAVYDRSPQLNKNVLKLLKGYLNDQEVSERYSNTKFFYQHLSTHSVPSFELKLNESPYILPYLIKSDRQGDLIISELRKINIITGIYNFDMNQNMLSPKFVKVVWIPVHGKITHYREQIIEILKRYENEK